MTDRGSAIIWATQTSPGTMGLLSRLEPPRWWIVPGAKFVKGATVTEGLLMYYGKGDDKGGMVANINHAVEAYTRKYGVAPNMVYISPALVNGAEIPQETGLTVKVSDKITPYHLWLGVKDGD